MSKFLTPAQRAQIITVDLDNPPPFMKVIADLSATREIAYAVTPTTSVWLYQPDWGAAAAIFDRREASGCRDMEDRDWIPYGAVWHVGGVTADKDPAQHRDWPLLIEGLNSPLAIPFLQNLVGICQQVISVTDYRLADALIDFKRPGGTRDTDIHADGLAGFRGFSATEHGNLWFPDATVAAEKGFRFHYDKDGMKGDNASVADLIQAGVPVYEPPLRSMAFFRGAGLARLGPTAWHAAYEIEAGNDYLRPCAIMNYKR